MTPSLTRRGALLGVAGVAAATAAAGVPRSTPAEAAPQSVRWGVNYTPTGPWYLIWNRWDAAQVRRDLEQVATLGVDHIRIQLPWTIFQPHHDRVDAMKLKRLEHLLDVADELGLDVCVTVMAVWLSGRSFRPKWTGRKNWLTSTSMIVAQHLYFDAVCRAVAGHPRVLGVDLGNELIAGRAPDTSLEQFAHWANIHLRTVRRHLPDGMHVVSSFGWPTPQRAELAVALGDATVVHSWDFRPDIGSGATLQPDCVHTAEYLTEAYRAYQPRNDRKLWLQEVGVPLTDSFGNTVVSPALAPDFLEQTLDNVLRCENLYGVTWWASHDIDERTIPGWLPANEYTLGLFDRDGRRKPAGDRFAELIAAQRAGSFGVTPVPRTVAIVGDDRPTFDTLIAAGERPTFVRPSLADNERHLRSRGITRVVQLGATT